MEDSKVRGVYTIAPTPFNEDSSLDAESIPMLVDFLVDLARRSADALQTTLHDAISRQPGPRASPSEPRFDRKALDTRALRSMAAWP